MDMASEMVHSLLPLFMMSIGATALDIGLIEGLAEASALISKVFSGALSDYLGKRKQLAVIGYAMGALSKPALALAQGSGMILCARLVDRLGKGIRGAPRDALVADVCPAGVRGQAYGLRQTLDAIGSFLGPLLVTALLWSEQLDFRDIFWIATLPALLSVAILWLGVHETAPTTPKIKTQNPLNRASISQLSPIYWRVVTIGAILTLARFSEAFLLLRAQQANWPLAWLPLVMVIMNLAYAFSAYPFGKLSDRLAPERILALGLVVLMAADLVLALTNSISGVMLAIILWGLHFGISQGLLTKMVADHAPSHLRGTAFGLFNLISGLALLLASLIAGWLWDHWGWSATFKAGAAFCGLAFAALLLNHAKPRTSS